MTRNQYDPERSLLVTFVPAAAREEGNPGTKVTIQELKRDNQSLIK